MKTGIGTLVITEVVYRRLKADSAMLKQVKKENAKLKGRIDELETRCDDQNERIVDMRFALEQLDETAEDAKEFLEEAANS